MSLYFKLFVTIVILTIVKNSTADIPYCDYFDTVDISDLERVNETYIYQGIEIPSNLIAEYKYRKIRYKSTEPVKIHLRACVCKVEPCVRICCPRKNMLANGTCNDGFNEEITLNLANVTLGVTTENVEWITNYFRLRDQFEMSDEMLRLNADEYVMLKDGSLILRHAKQIWPKEDYCLYPQSNSYDPFSIWVVKHTWTAYLMPASIETKAISTIFYILTLIVYLYVKKLRNVLGKCIISITFSLLIWNLIAIPEILSLWNRICLLAGYSRYFFGIANYLWFSVISFHLWKLLTNRFEDTSFATYSAIAWGMAAIPTGVIYVLNLIWEEDLHKWNWLPLVGYSGCRLEAQGPSHWIFLKGPMLILTLFNVIMFILTVSHIWKVKSELRKFKRDEERTIQCFNFDTETYVMFLRLSVIMGTFWILDFLYLLQDYSFFRHVYISILYIENSLAIVIFMLLILKSSTLKLLKERIRQR